MRVKFIQTADAFNYKDMLDVTSRTVVEFCRRHGFEYESFVGIKRGFYPWQASFNRLLMFKDLVESGYRGWVCYLDADAYIYDLDFDLGAYLADKQGHAGILTTVIGDKDYWSINNGVMFLNLAREEAREVIALWVDRFMAVSDQSLMELTEWPYDINDQTFLVDILGAHPRLREAMFYESALLMNHIYAAFIRQLVRAHFPAQRERTLALKTAVTEVLRDEDDFEERFYPPLISTLFRVLLHRDPEPGALEHFRPRFRQFGVETAFRETFYEFLLSREYLEKQPQKPVSGEQRVRAAYRWIFGRAPTDEELARHASALDRGEIGWQGLRALLIENAGLSLAEKSA